MCNDTGILLNYLIEINFQFLNNIWYKRKSQYGDIPVNLISLHIWNMRYLKCWNSHETVIQWINTNKYLWYCIGLRYTSVKKIPFLKSTFNAFPFHCQKGFVIWRYIFARTLVVIYFFVCLFRMVLFYAHLSQQIIFCLAKMCVSVCVLFLLKHNDIILK